jgi:hypothetical protein
MKTKIILLAALIGAATLSANAGVRFGVSIGFPAPIVVSRPVVYAPAPVTVVQTVLPCPGVDYVRAPGYWAYYPTGRVWVAGAWHYRPGYVVYGRDRDTGHNRDRYDGHDRDGHGGQDRDGYRR